MVTLLKNYIAIQYPFFLEPILFINPCLIMLARCLCTVGTDIDNLIAN